MEYVINANRRKDETNKRMYSHIDDSIDHMGRTFRELF